MNRTQKKPVYFLRRWTDRSLSWLSRQQRCKGCTSNRSNSRWSELVGLGSLKMEEKYSSNVLSGGQLGMVEVPDSRYVLLPSSKTLSLNWCNCFHVKNHSSLIHASVVHTLAYVKNWLLCKLSTAVEKPPLLFPIACCVRYLQPDTICKNTITKSRQICL